MPFGGGSGAGVSINPIAFIVIQPTGVKLLSVEHSSALDKLLDLVPDIVDRVNVLLDKQLQKIENASTKQTVEEISKNISKNISKDLSKDISKNISNDISKEVSENMAKTIIKDVAKDSLKDVASKVKNVDNINNKEASNNYTSGYTIEYDETDM